MPGRPRGSLQTTRRCRESATRPAIDAGAASGALGELVACPLRSGQGCSAPLLPACLARSPGCTGLGRNDDAWPSPNLPTWPKATAARLVHRLLFPPRFRPPRPASQRRCSGGGRFRSVFQESQPLLGPDRACLSRSSDGDSRPGGAADPPDRGHGHGAGERPRHPWPRPAQPPHRSSC